MKRYGVDLIFVTDGLNTENPESVIQESLLNGVAEYHSINLGMEVRRGLKLNAENCMSTGGKPPLGYDIDSDTKMLVINETEAEIVKLIFTRYGEDGYSYAEIAEELNSKGYRTKRGGQFKKNSFPDLLNNEKYLGTYIYNKVASKNVDKERNGHKFKNDDQIIRVEGGCPRIISDELWYKVQERRASKNNSHSTKHFYPLKDKIYCAECGSKMGGNTKPSGSNKKRYPTYDCNERKGKKGCTNKGINTKYIELFVARQLAVVLMGEKAVYDLTNLVNHYITTSKSPLKRSLDDAKRQLRIAKEKYNNIIRYVEEGRSRKPFEERLNCLDAQIANQEARISLLKQQIAAKKVTPNDIRAIRKNFVDTLLANNQSSRRVIRKYVDKVIVYRDHVEVTLNIFRDVKRK